MPYRAPAKVVTFPTGKPVTYDEIFVFRFAGGRIAETWGVVDVFSQMRQVGVIPAPPA